MKKATLIFAAAICLAGCHHDERPTNQSVFERRTREFFSEDCVVKDKIHEYTTQSGNKRIFALKYDTCWGVPTRLYSTEQKGRDEATGRNMTGTTRVMESNLVVDYYAVSPDARFLYILEFVNANSNGWTENYHLIRIDCETLETEEMIRCAAIKKTRKGFTAADCRLTNESTATCTADEEWLIHDVLMDWNGKVFFSDHREYDYREMERRYSHQHVKGFKEKSRLLDI